MAGNTHDHHEILKPHIPDGEELQDSFIEDDEDVDGLALTAVTDRRVIELTETGQSNTKEIEVESTFVTGDHIRGVKYKRNQIEGRSDLHVLVGALTVILGGVILLGSLGGTGLFGVLAGILLIGVGVFVLVFAEIEKRPC